MKLQDNEWTKCKCCGQRTTQTQEEKFGCDWCKKELGRVLEITMFGDEEDDPHLHLCSWKCVIAILPTLKPGRFLTLPYVSFDSDVDEGQDAADLMAILETIKEQPK